MNLGSLGCALFCVLLYSAEGMEKSGEMRNSVSAPVFSDIEDKTRLISDFQKDRKALEEERIKLFGIIDMSMYKKDEFETELSAIPMGALNMRDFFGNTALAHMLKQWCSDKKCEWSRVSDDDALANLCALIAHGANPGLANEYNRLLPDQVDIYFKDFPLLRNLILDVFARYHVYSVIPKAKTPDINESKKKSPVC